MSKRFAIFNHKGGVSKTTTAYNVGWILSRKYRVLLVDADPQCNLSGMIFGDSFDSYYMDEKTKHDNIKDGVSVAFQARPYPIVAVQCFSPERSKNLFLLAGHANLSEYDAALSFAQTTNNAISTLQNLPGAFAKLITLTEERYNIDYTIIDLNPSLSAINQNLFLSSHAFILPTNPDPFSIMAINTLQKLLPRWVKWKKDVLSLFADSAYPMSDGVPKFLGCIIQRFNIRNGKAAGPFKDNIEVIKNEISTNFINSIKKDGMLFSAEQYGQDLIDNRYCLTEIPDFQGLLPKAHHACVPVFELTDEEIEASGVVLEGMRQRRETFEGQFVQLADRLTGLLKNA